MKSRLKNILIAILLVAPALLFIGCEKDFSDQDNDLMTGKWRNAGILSLENAKETDLMAFIEIAPYSSMYDKRTFKIITFEYDSTQAFPYLRYTKIGHYTLKGDTLLIKDYKLKEKSYIVQYVKKDTLCYKDDKDSLYIYIKYDGSLNNGKKIQDIYKN